jgi:hypothetical protein
LALIAEIPVVVSPFLYWTLFSSPGSQVLLILDLNGMFHSHRFITPVLGRMLIVFPVARQMRGMRCIKTLITFRCEPNLTVTSDACRDGT